MKKRKKIKRILIIFIIIGFLIGCYAIVDNGLRPNLVAQGEAKLKNIAVNIMNNSVSEALEEAGDTTNLIRAEKDKDGKITMISADSAMMNKIAVKSALNAQRKINELQNTQISIPLGNVLGSKLFSGLGPAININVTPLGVVNTNFHTEFESAGINQSRYKVYIKLDSNMKMVVGATSQSVEISTEILISDVILVGAVPDTYANLTDSGDFLNLIP